MATCRTPPSSVRATKRNIRVGVRGGQFPGCVGFAQRQSVLWREAFPVDIDLRPLTGGQGSPLLASTLSFHEGVRRLLFLQYRVMLANVDGALAGTSDEALHDLHIALRRMRAVLRIFRRPLARTSAKSIDRDLQQLNRVLGIARDLDVWIGFFSKASVQLTGHRLWPKFVSHQIELRRMQQATVKRQLHGARFAALQLRIGRFLPRGRRLPAEAAVAPRGYPGGPGAAGARQEPSPRPGAGTSPAVPLSGKNPPAAHCAAPASLPRQFFCAGPGPARPQIEPAHACPGADAGGNARRRPGPIPYFAGRPDAAPPAGAAA